MCPAAIRALVAAPTARRPSIVVGPVDRPPCSLQRPLGRALALHGAPVLRAWAPHCFLGFMIGSYLQEFGGRNTHQGGSKIAPLYIASVFLWRSNLYACRASVPIRSHAFRPFRERMEWEGMDMDIQSNPSIPKLFSLRNG